MGDESAHENIVTVTGTGASSNRIVDDEDTWTVTVTTMPQMLTLPNVGGNHTWMMAITVLTLLGVAAMVMPQARRLLLGREVWRQGIE
jgi:hypothetical protein